MSDAEINAAFHQCFAILRAISKARGYTYLHVNCGPQDYGTHVRFYGIGRRISLYFGGDPLNFPDYRRCDTAAQSELEEYRLRAGA